MIAQLAGHNPDHHAGGAGAGTTLGELSVGRSEAREPDVSPRITAIPRGAIPTHFVNLGPRPRPGESYDIIFHTALYFKAVRGKDWGEADPREVMGKAFSNISGW